MKFSPILFAPLLVSAAPGALRSTSDQVVKRQAAAVTTAELAEFTFFAQYSAAADCNGAAAAGAAVACANNGCPEVEAAGATVITSFSGVITDIEGYLARDDVNKLIVVSYRGSTSLRNWIADFVFYFVGCDDLVSGCEVHAGFSQANDETWDKMLAALTTTAAQNPSYRIVFTGHSLGAAVATLAAARARNAGFAIDIYNYGSPRVGNEAFAEFVGNQAGQEYRVTHLDDPVPKLPPIFLGYRHISPEYWLSDGNATTIDYTPADVKICDGTANLSCNAGTGGFDTTAHLYYLTYMSACGTGFTFKNKRDAAVVDATANPPMNVTASMSTIDTPSLSDAQYLAKMEDYAAQDLAAVQAM